MNQFVSTCIEYGKIDVNEKIIDNENTLLDATYKKLNSNQNNGEYSHFSEAIMHAFIQHYDEEALVEDQQKLDRHVPALCREDAATYYLSPDRIALKNLLYMNSNGV